MDLSKCGIPEGIGAPCAELVQNFPVSFTVADGETLTDLQQVVDPDGAYLWRGVSVDVVGGDVGLELRFCINDNYYLSNDLLPLDLAWNAGEEGAAHTPEFVLDGGAKIGIEVRNPTGEEATGTVWLLGVKRVRV